MKTLLKSAANTRQTGDLVAATNGRKVKPSMTIIIPKRRDKTMTLHIVGKTPLICHAWSAKAVKMMLDKQMGIASAGREKKNPIQDFRESLYRMHGGKGYGFPSPGFKACCVNAANDVEMKMTECKRNVHVSHYLVKIDAPKLAKENFTEWDTKYASQLKAEHKLGVSMRMDLVRLESGVADIRFRGCFPVWSCSLDVEYNELVLTAEQVVNLFASGGSGCGIGEWRPSSPESKSGEYGRFYVK